MAADIIRYGQQIAYLGVNTLNTGFLTKEVRNSISKEEASNLVQCAELLVRQMIDQMVLNNVELSEYEVCTLFQYIFDKVVEVTYKTIKMLNKRRIPYLIVTKSHIVADDEYIEILDKDFSTKTCGEIVDVNKEGIVVKTLDGSIVLKTIKPFGKKMMNAKDYVNGIGKDNLIGKVFK